MKSVLFVVFLMVTVNTIITSANEIETVFVNDTRSIDKVSFAFTGAAYFVLSSVFIINLFRFAMINKNGSDSPTKYYQSYILLMIIIISLTMYQPTAPFAKVFLIQTTLLVLSSLIIRYCYNRIKYIYCLLVGVGLTGLLCLIMHYTLDYYFRINGMKLIILAICTILTPIVGDFELILFSKRKK
jgi:hypothetical protein